MTTPLQTAGQAFGTAVGGAWGDLTNLVGQGAFQVGNAAQNWGQNITESFAKALIYGPATLLAEGWESIEAFLAQLGSYLGTLPLEALRILQAFIPGSVAGAFADVETAVSTILGALGTNLTMTWQAFQSWLTDVYNIIQTEVHQIMDIINNLVVTPITSRVTAFQDWFNSLTGLATGVSEVISGTPPSPATFADAAAGAVADLGGLLNNIHTGVTGAVNVGQQATADVVQGALAGLNGAVAGAQAQVAQIFGMLAPKPPAKIVGGSAPTPAEVPTGWESDWTITGSAAGSETVTDKGWSIVETGHTARTLIAINNTDETDTAYQSVRFLLKTNIETPLAGGGDLAGNSVIFRCDSDTTPANYGELRLYYNRIELIGVVAGSPTLLHTWSVTPSWGLTYALDAGTADGLNYYRLEANGLQVGDVFHDVSSVINTVNLKGGQAMYTDDRGGTAETSPGIVMYWRLSDNPPTQKVGSGFKVCRVNTTGASFASGTNIFPANFYDTVDRITPDFSWDASTSTMTVRDEGWYTFKINLPFLNSSGQFMAPSASPGGNGSKVVTLALAVDGVLDSFSVPCSIYVGGIEFSSPPIYCQAGAEVFPVYSSAAGWTISGGYGAQTAFERVYQYFSGAKLGQVVV